MKKLFILIILLSACQLMNAEIRTGDISASSSDNVSYTYDTETHVFTISGTGNTATFTQLNRPWYSYKDSIRTLVVGEGVTDLGSYYFANCSALDSVSLPSTLTKIYNGVFSRCTSLPCIVIPSGVTYVGTAAFSGCSSLSHLVPPAYANNWQDRVLDNCPALQEIVASPRMLYYVPQDYNLGGFYRIPDGINRIAKNCFQYTHLRAVAIPASVSTIGDYAFYAPENPDFVVFFSRTTPVEHNLRVMYDDSGTSVVPFTYPIYVPAGTLAAYQESWGTDFNFVEGDVVDYVRTTMPAPEAFLRKVSKDGGVRVETDSNVVQVRAYGRDSLYLYLKPGYFCTDSTLLKYDVRRTPYSAAEDVWTPRTMPARYVDAEDCNYMSLAGLKANICLAEYRAALVYVTPTTNAAGVSTMRYDTVFSNPVYAEPLFALTFAGNDDQPWQYELATIGNGELGEASVYTSGDTLWRHGWDTLAIRSVGYGDVCHTGLVRMIDVAGMYYSGYGDYDSIFTPSQVLFDGNRGVQYGSLCLAPAPFVVLPELSDSIVYYLLDQDFQPIDTIRAACGEQPVAPVVTVGDNTSRGWMILSEYRQSASAQVYSDRLPETHAPMWLVARWTSDTAIEGVLNSGTASKMLRDGKIIILLNGKEYDVLGREK